MKTSANAAELQRTKPDYILFCPTAGAAGVTDNEHVLVFRAPHSAELLALWTQSTVEGRGDNHLVLARSRDGKKWSAPEFLVGAHAGTKELQASWGFPVISSKGRLYCFYLRERPVIDTSRQGSGSLGCIYSDDNGLTWSNPDDVPMQRNRFDHPDPAVPRNWIVWQLPIRDRRGRQFVGYTQVTSRAVFAPPEGWWTWDSRSAFMRFDNIDDNPPAPGIHLTWLPTDREGLEVPHRSYPGISMAQEPAPALLPDGRLLVVMRTMEGHVWYSVSDDDGATWRKPEILLFQDREPIKHPLAPCPLFTLQNGRYLLLFHDNDGTLGAYSQYSRDWSRCNHLNHIRRPLYLAVGRYAPGAHQPIWFEKKLPLADTQGVVWGPKRTAELAMYSSLTEFNGERVLWYPDRKYFLLGKRLTDEWLDGRPPDDSK